MLFQYLMDIWVYTDRGMDRRRDGLMEGRMDGWTHALWSSFVPTLRTTGARAKTILKLVKRKCLDCVYVCIFEFELWVSVTSVAEKQNNGQPSQPFILKKSPNFTFSYVTDHFTLFRLSLVTFFSHGLRCVGWWASIYFWCAFCHVVVLGPGTLWQ